MKVRDILVVRRTEEEFPPREDLSLAIRPLVLTPGRRDFLPRPLAQGDSPDLWDAWGPLFDWLREHHPDYFFAVCEAEEAIRALERSGITAGQEYEQACAELLWRFEEARRLKRVSPSRSGCSEEIKMLNTQIGPELKLGNNYRLRFNWSGF